MRQMANTTQITETSIELIRSSPYTSFINGFQDIDWTSFDSVSVYTKGEGDDLYSLHFNKLLTGIRKTIDLKKSIVTNFRASPENVVYIFIPKSAGNYKSSLSLAGNRLKELAKNDLSFNVIPIKPEKKPSNGKPTYRESIDFIYSYFDDLKDPYKTFYYQNGYLASKGYRINYINFSGPKLFIGYSIEEENYVLKTLSTTSIQKEIDISEIENIEIGSFGYRDKEITDNRDVVYMTFVMKGKSSPKTIDLPFDVVRPEVSPNTKKDTQIFKAFNHLRKLFGAPEPISFD